MENGRIFFSLGQFFSIFEANVFLLTIWRFFILIFSFFLIKRKDDGYPACEGNMTSLDLDQRG